MSVGLVAVKLVNALNESTGLAEKLAIEMSGKVEFD